MKRLIYLLTGLAVPAAAQDFDPSNLGAAYAHLLSVVAQPEVSVSNVEIDTGAPNEDLELDALHLPFYREFGSWYFQASAGYATYTQELSFPEARAELESEWDALNGIVEAGLLFPVTEALSWTVGASAGVARLENDLSERGEVDIDPELQSSIFNWDTNAAIYRAHGSVRYDVQNGDYRLKGVAHLTYSYVDSFSESSGFDGFSDDSGAAIFLFDVSRRINDPDAKREVYVIGHLGSTHFLGGNRDQLGFDQYFEFGASIGVDKYAAGILFIYGDDVDGLSLTFNYDY